MYFHSLTTTNLTTLFVFAENPQKLFALLSSTSLLLLLYRFPHYTYVFYMLCSKSLNIIFMHAYSLLMLILLHYSNNYYYYSFVSWRSRPFKSNFQKNKVKQTNFNSQMPSSSHCTHCCVLVLVWLERKSATAVSAHRTKNVREALFSLTV